MVTIAIEKLTFILLTMVFVFNSALYGDRLYTPESDVYRRQIPTHKDGPASYFMIGILIEAVTSLPTQP